MRHPVAVLAAMALATLAAGCATVLDGDRQSITVDTRSNGVAVPGVRCLLKNGQGEAWLTTPGSASVRFDRSDLEVVCRSDLFEGPGVSAASQVKPKVLGNLLVGGLIGFGVDHVAGAAYGYPSTIVVEMSPRPGAMPPPDPAVGRARLVAVRAQAAASLDLTRSLGLVRSTACEPVGPLTLQAQDGDLRQYRVACRDGRTARTVCQPSECRFRTLDD